MAKLLTPNEGKGLELFQYIRQALGMPEAVTVLEIKFSPDEPITVKTSFLATEQAQK